MTHSLIGAPLTISQIKLIIVCVRMSKIESFLVSSCFLVLLCSQMKETEAFVAGGLTSRKRNVVSGDVKENDPSQQFGQNFGKLAIQLQFGCIVKLPCVVREKFSLVHYMTFNVKI